MAAEIGRRYGPSDRNALESLPTNIMAVRALCNPADLQVDLAVPLPIQRVFHLAGMCLVLPFNDTELSYLNMARAAADDG